MKDKLKEIFTRRFSAPRLAAVMAAVSALAMLAPQVQAADYHSIAHPQNMERFGCTLPKDDYVLADSSAPLFVFYADEKVNLTLKMKRGNDKGEVKDFSLDFQEITQRIPEASDPNLSGVADFGSPEMMRTEGKPVRFPFSVTFDDKDVAQVEVKDVPVPTRFGTYAVILVRSNGGKDSLRQFLGTVARVPRDNPDATVHNTWILGEGNFINGDPKTMDIHAAAYERMGIRGQRIEISTSEQWTPEEKKAGKADQNGVGPYDWSRYDVLFDVTTKHKIGIMGTLGGMNGDWWHFRVEPTPAAGWTDKCFGYSGSGDWVIDPQYYPRYGKWITAFCQRYWKDGKGSLWGLENYNEPWEGGGISGWARDMIQYREIQKVIADSARKVSPDIKIFAASSIMNTEDKFYSDGTDEMSKYVDIFSDHYVKPPVCYGPMVAATRGKTSVETESWMANSEYRLPIAVLTFLAAGQSRINPWHPRDLFDGMPGGSLTPTPVVVATATMNALTSGKQFEKVAFLKHLPWLFQFGKDDDPKGITVLYGQLISFGCSKPQENVTERPWAQVENVDGGTITIDNADGILEFLDIAGNTVFKGEKSVTLPMGFIPIYIRSAKGPGAVAERFKTAKIEGKRPVEILPEDFTTPLNSPDAVLNVRIHNCMNRAIKGKLSVKTPAEIVLATPSQDMELAAGETKKVAFKINVPPLGPQLASRRLINEANAYPCSFVFESDAGKAEYSETLNAAIVPKAKITVDGNLDDWKNIPGINLISTKKEKLDITEAARRPWLDTAGAQPDGTFAEVKMAWDENFLYVSARVNDPKPQTNKPRMETRNDDDYFHSAKSDSESPYKEFLDTRKIGDKTLRELGFSFSQVPFVYKKGADNTWSGDHLQLAFDVTDDWHDLKPNTDRVPAGFTAWPDTDYEYSAYLCDDGKSELWRMLAPGVARVHDYPHQPKPKDKIHTGAVKGAQHIVKQEGNVRIYEIAIPKSELSTLKLAKDTTFGFAFQVGNDSGPSLFSGLDKAVCKSNGLSMHPYWLPSPSCGVRWTLVE